MSDLVQELMNDYLDHAVDLVKVEKDLQGHIVGHLKRLEKDLIAQLADADIEATQLNKARLNKLLIQTRETIKTSVGGAKKEYDKYLLDFSKVEAKANIAIPNAVIGASIFSTNLSSKQLQELCRDTLIQGAPSREWWGRMEKKTAEQFADEIRQGVMAGETLSQITQRVRGKSTSRYATYKQFVKTTDKDGVPDWKPKMKDGKPVTKHWMEFKGGVMGVTTREAESLARTSIQTVANEVRNQVIKENADFCKGYEWLSTLDLRTTPQCQALDGNKWDLEYKPVGGSLAFPGVCPHWGCRSTLVPWLRPMSEISKGKLKDLPEGQRTVMADTWPSATGMAPSKITYTDWFDRQPVERQLEILGPGKLRLYKDNKLSFRDLVDGNGQPLSIAELEKKIAKKGFKPKSARVPDVDKKKLYLDTVRVQIKDPITVAEFQKGTKHGSLWLNKTSLKSAKPRQWDAIEDIDLGEPILKPVKGKRISSGVLIEEPDGRVWIYEPKDHYAGYEHTFPKGSQEKGFSLQQTAVKEAFEESGLDVELTGYLGDFEKSESVTRYYTAKRRGGDPGDAHWESQSVKLVPKEKLKDYLNTDIDRHIVEDYFNKFCITNEYLEYMPGSQGGTNPGGIFKHKLTGKKFYGKFYTNPEQGRAELLANSLANEIGIGAPQSRMLTVDVPTEMTARLGKKKREIVLTEFIEGLEKLGDKVKKKWVQEQLAKQHIFAGLVEDWDVIGLDYDNLLVDKNLKVYVVDQGGSFRFRAQGQEKPFGPNPHAFETLISDKNTAAKSVLGPVFESFTKPNSERLSRWIKNLTDPKIRRIAARCGVTDEEIIENLISRKKILSNKLLSFGKHLKKVEIPDTIPNTSKIINDVKKSRIVGKTIKGDREFIEDANILFWQETVEDGGTLTRAKLKLTHQGNKRVVQRLKKYSNIGSELDPRIDLNDEYFSKVEAFAKTVNYHVDDGAYNTGTVTNAEKLAKDLSMKVREAADEGTKKMATYYLDQLELISEAMENKTSVEIIEKFKLPPLPKQSTSNVVQVKPTKMRFYAKKTKKGFAIEDPKQEIWTLESNGLEVTFESGNRIKFLKYQDGNPFNRGDNDYSYAFRGQMDLFIDGDLTDEKLLQFYEDMKLLGIDPSPPTREFQELLYLKQGAYINNWDQDDEWIQIWSDGGLSDEMKLKRLKQHIRDKYSIDLPDSDYPDWYNPFGQENSFGEGWNRRYRWDLPTGKVEEKMEGYILHHSTCTNIPTLIDELLEQGGDFTSTTERTRKGISISRGMSPKSDIRTGGANYLFTRIKDENKGGWCQGLRFKIRNLSRMDAISYSGDRYGATYGNVVREYRGRELSEFKSFAGYSSNETILKYGLNILDELQDIIVSDETEKKKLIQIFKKHGWERLPDGRPIKDIIFIK